MKARVSFLLALAALAVGLSAPVQAQTSQEEVKATFVYRFISFVTWPEASGTGPVRICVVGADPFARTLARVVTGQRANGHAFEVTRITSAADADHCDVVYVVGDRTTAILRASRERPVLTVTDSVSGGERGIIHFAVVDGRVRFYIDDASAAEAGLGIDARLLNLALSVRRRS